MELREKKKKEKTDGRTKFLYESREKTSLRPILIKKTLDQSSINTSQALVSIEGGS